MLTMCALTGNCQSVYSLEDYWNFAKNNYPAITRYNMLEEAETYTLANAHLTMFPKYDKLFKEENLNTFLSDKLLSIPVKKRTVSIFNRTMPVIKTDDIDYNNNLFILNKRVNSIYFSLILIDKKINLNESFQTHLADVVKDILASKNKKVNNKKNLNAIYKLSANIIKKEVILMDQKRIYLNMLSKIVGKKLDNTTQFNRTGIFQDINDIDANMDIDARNLYLYNKIFKNGNILSSDDISSSNEMKVLQAAGINSIDKKSMQQRDINEIIFKIDSRIEREKEYSEIITLQNSIEDSANKLSKIMESTTVTYVKLMEGEADIDTFIKSVILYNNRHNTLEAHKIALLLSLNRFKFLYENK